MTICEIAYSWIMNQINSAFTSLSVLKALGIMENPSSYSEQIEAIGSVVI